MSEQFNPYHKWLGIPPKDQPPNHYRLLGLDLFESDLDVIEAAFQRQMAYVRTYQLGPHSELSQKILNEIAAAKVCLLIPDEKAEYDRKLRDWLAEQDPTTPPDLPPAVTPAPPVVVAASAGGEASSRGDDAGPPAVSPLAHIGSMEPANGAVPPPAHLPRAALAGVCGLLVLTLAFVFLLRPGASDSESAPTLGEERDPSAQTVLPVVSSTPEARKVAEKQTPAASQETVTTLGSAAETRTTVSPPQPAPTLKYHVWEWHPAGAKPFRLKFFTDGTVGRGQAQTGERKFTWSIKGNRLTLRWPQHGWVDTMTMSQDGRSLKGRNQYGRQISARLIGTNLDPP